MNAMALVTTFLVIVAGLIWLGPRLRQRPPRFSEVTFRITSDASRFIAAMEAAGLAARLQADVFEFEILKAEAVLYGIELDLDEARLVYSTSPDPEAMFSDVLREQMHREIMRRALARKIDEWSFKDITDA